VNAKGENLGSVHPKTLFPLPLERLCRNEENCAIPAKAGIQVREIVVVFKFLDARLRGHDEL
jgi:hypothetical protein